MCGRRRVRAPAAHPERRDRRDWHSARHVALASLLMVPVLLVAFVLAELAGAGFQAAFGLTEDQSLREAGALGVLAGVLLILFIVSPEAVGILLGVKARQLGERRLGTVGVVVNAAIGAYLLLAGVLSLALD